MAKAKYLQEFGEQVKNLRVKNGILSQRNLAEKIGVSNSTIAKIERGAHDASEDTMRKLADAFKMSFEELLVIQGKSLRNDELRLDEKMKKLTKVQLEIITGMVDEFLRLGGK